LFTHLLLTAGAGGYAAVGRSRRPVRGDPAAVRRPSGGDRRGAGRGRVMGPSDRSATGSRTAGSLRRSPEGV